MSSAPRPQTEQRSAVARRAQPAADRDLWPVQASPSAPGREVQTGDQHISRFATPKRSTKKWCSSRPTLLQMLAAWRFLSIGVAMLVVVLVFRKI